jgi:hypothetical protein
MSGAGEVIEITRLEKVGGPLTKSIRLSSDGGLISDGSACVMSRGRAQRVRLAGLGAVADLIQSLESHEAIALGSMRWDLPDHVRVVTQDQLARLNGTTPAPADTIARTGNYILYEAERPALALVDVDTKGMPAAVRARIEQAGGFWAVLVSVLPSLETTGHITRRSTSTGIIRTDTGTALSGSNGMHVYLHVQDGADIERFLRALHERCWLAGYGWHMVGAGGQLLDRSLVDRMVYAPERLVFEGAPVLGAPLAQDPASRRPAVFDHPPLDTKEACPPLRLTEQARLKDLKSRSAHALAPDRAKARDHFITQHAERLAERTGISAQEARRVIERQCDGVLLPDLVLPWDDEDFANCSVGDVLRDPARFVGATLADPLEGPDYGRSKAMVMRRADGTPWINSFAHGRTAYELRSDARAADAAIAAAPPDQVADVFVRIVSNADLDADQLETLRNRVSDISGVGKRTLDTKVKATRQKQASQHARAERDRKAAERYDPRPRIPAPLPDAPWIPQMQVLNDVLGASDAPEPPMRDIDDIVVQVRVRRIPNMHAFTPQGVNEGEAAEARQPPPEQPVLTRLTEAALAELIERSIDYVDETGRSVHLAAQFVKHFLTRSDDALPVVAAIATLPLVLQDGTLLAKRGLDRQRGIVFRVPPHLLSVIPDPADCTPAAVAEAMRYLIEEWLCDVAANYAGMCTLIAAALTIIERSLLSDRPTFFVTAGRRGGGKTTALVMLLMAVTGIRPAAAAWSPNEEERRKALLAYLMEAVPAIIWDNIPRGTQISCPHIEKSCTTAFYSDRKLGVSEFVAVSAAVIHLFTGNNIGPKGDLSSRSLKIGLETDRTDPENRDFKHPDPVGWTEANRDKILRALYIILLGNPALRSNDKAPTRFKTWWRLVGSAVENAAARHAEEHANAVAAMVEDANAPRPKKIDFRDLFLAQEEDDEESASLGDALAALANKWPDRFQSTDIAKLINNRSEYQIDTDKECAATVREFLFPRLQPSQDVSAKSLGKALKCHVGEPLRNGARTLILRTSEDTHSKIANFFVQVKQS